MSNNAVTLKTRLGVVREIFISDRYLAPPPVVIRRNFVKMFDADKTRMIGLPYGVKTMTIC